MSNNHHDDDKTQTHTALRSGMEIAHYRIINKIGAGGMGEVYLAEDTLLDRRIALKFIFPHLCEDEDCRTRFRREATATARLNHPNIVTIHEVGEYGGRPYIAMEYVEGQSLKERIETGVVRLERVISGTIQVCEGLAAAHKEGVIHRDIKPSNILVDTDGRARILDFGLAQVSGSEGLTRTGSTMGTIGYMSPEQIAGREIDHRSDLFSVGVILYELFAERPPFRKETDAATMNAVLNNTPEPVTCSKFDIPDELQQVISKLLQKNPAERYQSAADVAVDLKRISQESGSRPNVSQSTHRIPSIAVLPFTNLSADPEQEYFCDGMAEEIINALTHVDGLRVVARTSCFAFKGKNEDIREIGRKLNVSTVLEGSVRKSGNLIRITGQLINVSDGYHLWSEKFDRNLEDIFAVQDEISLAIVDNLKIKLLKEEESKVLKHRTKGTDAYQSYLMGRWFLEKRTEKGILKAIDCFQLAIEKDPSYALAYAGVADSYILLPQYSSTSFKEAYMKSREAALMALHHDENLGEAYTSLAMIKTDHDRDWKGGLLDFERAIELNPRNAASHHWYGFTLMQLARFDEAEREIIKALELDPVSPIVNRNLGLLYYYSGQYDLAVTQLRKGFELDENLPYTHIFLGFALFQQSKYEESFAELQKEKKISGSYNIGADAAIGSGYAIMGDETRAREILADIQQRIKRESIVNQCTHIANLCLLLGEIDKSFELLENAYQGREIWLTFIKVNPHYDSIRDDPRFIALLKKMGLQD